MSKYNQPEYDGFFTSAEILQAIETLAGDNILDEEGRAYKLWAAPVRDQEKQVAELAWIYASEETIELYWGDRLVYTRNV